MNDNQARLDELRGHRLSARDHNKGLVMRITRLIPWLLLILGFQAQAVTGPISISDDYEVIVTIQGGAGDCKPSIPSEINIHRTDKSKKITVTWTVDDPQTFRFFKQTGEGKRGVDFGGDPPSYEDSGSSGVSGSPHKHYKWKFKKPRPSSSDQLPRTYTVNVFHRTSGTPCLPADPVVVNSD